MQELIHQLKARFPLLGKLEVEATDQTSREPLPAFIGLALAALDSVAPKGSCFILPRKGEVGRLCAVLMALSKLDRNFKSLCSNLPLPCNTNDPVRIHPGKQIFVFQGVWDENPVFFWLGCPNGRRTFPRSQAFRIERTDRTAPIGNLKGDLLGVSKPPIDLLLSLESYGNLSFVPNYLLVLDPKGHFREFTESTTLTRVGAAPFSSRIADLGIIGSINEDGSLTGLEAGRGGHPLIAVTSSIDALIAASSSANGSATVLINDVGLLKSPQHFDSIVEKSNLIIIAEHDEWEAVNALRQRDCKVWPFGEGEIGLGVSADNDGKRHAGFFSSVFTASTNSQAVLKPVPCEYSLLESVSTELEALSAAIRGDGNDELRGLVRRLFGLLNFASGVLVAPPASELAEMATRIAQVRAELDRQRHWIPALDQARITKSCTLLDEVFREGSEVGSAKRDRLKTIFEEMRTAGRSKIGVLTKREQHFEGIRSVARQCGLEVTVFTAQPALLPDEFFDAVVCVSWPGSDGFRKFFRRYMAPDIRFVGYPFELRWLRQSSQRIQREGSGRTMTKEEKSALVHVEPSVKIDWPDAPHDPHETPTPTPMSPTADFSIFAFERTLLSSRRGSGISQTDPDEKVQAKYAEFAGDKFAYITEGHRLPVATHLVFNPNSASQKLPEREVAGWQVGDYIVFFESGDVEVLQEIANRIMGARALPLRRKARIWRDALVSSGLSVSQLQERLTRIGCQRTTATLRNWVSKNSQIGPEDKRDLIAIASVTNSSELREEIESVWSAIQEIWSYHQSAGTVLRRILAQRLPTIRWQIEEEGTEVPIEDQGQHLGSATIVKVERIDQAFEPCSRSLVNRLRSEERLLFI